MVRRRGEGRDSGPSLFHALRTFRRVLLPQSEVAAKRRLAAGQELELTHNAKRRFIPFDAQLARLVFM